MKNVLTSKNSLKHPILVLIMFVTGVALVRLLQTEQSLSSITYAFYLFGVLIHEIGHSVAALITGGYVQGFVVNAGSGGYAVIGGGSPLFVLPAGYVGCAIFGSLFFYLSNRYRWADLFAVSIGLFLIGFTVIFGRPEENGSMTALYVAVGFGFILLASGYKGPLWLNMLLVNIITTLTALQGLLGAWSLYLNSQGWHHNDAVMFSEIVAPWLSGNQVAAIWAAFSVVLFLLAFYFGIVKTIFHEGKKQWNYIKGNTLHKD